uniref:UspA domain-containing protein n=1 Tax=Chlamydomonas euryale TaxID=1486919 RepID=A0A7R9Z5H8_9CHLO
MVVPTDMQVDAGQRLLMRHAASLGQAGLHTSVHVLVQGYHGLLDSLVTFLTSKGAGLVVMGSRALTAAPAALGSAAPASTPASSVSLAVVKRLPMPVVLLTKNSRVAGTGPGSGGGGGGGRERRATPRVMAVVEPHARPMLKYLVDTCMDPARGDTLLLGQVFATRLLTLQQQKSARHLLESWLDDATKAHLPVAKTTLDGPFDKALQSRSDGLQLLALQLKSHDKNLPADVLSLVRSSHAPVMLFKSRAHAVHSTE